MVHAAIAMEYICVIWAVLMGCWLLWQVGRLLGWGKDWVTAAWAARRAAIALGLAEEKAKQEVRAQKSEKRRRQDAIALVELTFHERKQELGDRLTKETMTDYIARF